MSDINLLPEELRKKEEKEIQDARKKPRIFEIIMKEPEEEKEKEKIKGPGFLKGLLLKREEGKERAKILREEKRKEIIIRREEAEREREEIKPKRPVGPSAQIGRLREEEIKKGEEEKEKAKRLREEKRREIIFKREEAKRKRDEEIKKREEEKIRILEKRKEKREEKKKIKGPGFFGKWLLKRRERKERAKRLREEKRKEIMIKREEAKRKKEEIKPKRPVGPSAQIGRLREEEIRKREEEKRLKREKRKKVEREIKMHIPKIEKEEISGKQPPKEKELKISFIPEEFAKVSELEPKKQFAILGVVIFCSLIIVGFLYLGILQQERRFSEELKKIDFQVESLNKEIASYEEIKKDALKLREQLLAVKEILEKHICLTKFFNLLEKYTVEDVYYTDFTIGGENKVVLRARGKNFESAAQQMVAFKGVSHFIKEVKISSVSAETQTGKEGGVGFNINLTLVDNIFKIIQKENVD